MRPGIDPEDIHTILNRFQTWAGKEPGNSNGRNSALESDSVREVPYEEAMRHFQERHKAHPRRVVRATAEPVAQKASSERAAATPKQESAPVSPIPPTEAASQVTPTQAKTEPELLAQRFPAFVTKASPAAQPSEKKKKKKPVTQEKKASAEAAVPIRPSTPVSRKKPVPSKPPSRRVAAKESAPLAAARRGPGPAPKGPEFRKVLAKTVRSVDPSSSSAADRNRRITTRFSSSEERRLERAAEQAGLTVSAWLRQCALHAEAASAPPRAPSSRSKAKKQAVPSPSAGSTLFSAAAPSRVGWLTLLRQRFLSSHARFSERA